METTTFHKQYPIALAAIAEHMSAHELVAPLDIFVVDEFRDGRMAKAIRLHLGGQHTHEAWLESVIVDGVSTEPTDAGHGVRHEWFVRLPESGIRLQLVGYRHEALAVSA